jgi:hypothetical protein
MKVYQVQANGTIWSFDNRKACVDIADKYGTPRKNIYKFIFNLSPENFLGLLNDMDIDLRYASQPVDEE